MHLFCTKYLCKLAAYAIKYPVYNVLSVNVIFLVSSIFTSPALNPVWFLDITPLNILNPYSTSGYLFSLNKLFIQYK